jgi:hypothetical protein
MLAIMGRSPFSNETAPRGRSCRYITAPQRARRKLGLQTYFNGLTGGIDLRCIASRFNNPPHPTVDF